MLLPATVFEAAFKRERALATRTKRQFTLVVLIPSSSQSDEPEFIATALRNRLRESDIAGRLGEDRIALLLPETDENGAHAFMDSILATLADANLQYDYDLFCYPRRCGQRETNGGGQYGQTKPSSQPVDGIAAAEFRVAPDVIVAGSVASTTSLARRTLAGPGALPEDGATIGTDGSALRVKVPVSHATHIEALDEDHGLDLAEIRTLVGRTPARDLDELLLRPVGLCRRIVDVVVSGTLMLLLSPLFAVIGILIKATSPGPIFFCQERAGLGGRPFCFYKFRSMHVDAESRKDALRSENEKDGPIFKIQNDPRITPIGRLIRKASIDELPQLFNVFRGDMTLIGPRPATLDEVAQYEPWQRERLALQGGLTCIWQVSGRSEIEFDDWMRMDLRYARDKCVLLDASLLLRTVGAVVTGRGAY